jgi:hypothetical protein
MALYTTGLVLGVRTDSYAAKDTGEIRVTRTLDLYDDVDGPGSFSLRDDVEDPTPGQRITATVVVSAYSGFVKRDGGVGDAKLRMSITKYTVEGKARKTA